MGMAPEEAVKYCVEVLGWKRACIPSETIRAKFGLYNKHAVFEYPPTDFFDTPRTFQFAVVPL